MYFCYISFCRAFVNFFPAFNHLSPPPLFVSFVSVLVSSFLPLSFPSFFVIFVLHSFLLSLSLLFYTCLLSSLRPSIFFFCHFIVFIVTVLYPLYFRVTCNFGLLSLPSSYIFNAGPYHHISSAITDEPS